MRAGSGIAAAVLLGLAPASAHSAPAPAHAGAMLKAAGGVRPGLWQVRMLEEAARTPPRDLCLGDVRLLMQLRHGSAACGSFVIANEAKLTTIQYSCPGAGWGRTSLRLISSTQVHLDSQGIADNAPFAFVAEARRTGECPAHAATPPAPQPAAAAPPPAAPPPPAPPR